MANLRLPSDPRALALIADRAEARAFALPYGPPGFCHAYFTLHAVARACRRKAVRVRQCDPLVTP